MESNLNYVIELPNKQRSYLCYPKSKQAIVYAYPADKAELKRDLTVTKGSLYEFTGVVEAYICGSSDYSNKYRDEVVDNELKLCLEHINEKFREDARQTSK